MTCPDCAERMGVVKTAVLPSRTIRVNECLCGSRFETEEKVIRRLPMARATGPQPARNGPVEAGNPPVTANVVRGVGGDLLSGSDPVRISPDPIGIPDPTRSDQPPAAAPAAPGKVWSAQDWLTRFKRSWPDLHPGKMPFYGSPGDTQAAVKFDAFLSPLPPEERVRLQGRAQDLFAAWAAVDDQAVMDAGHIFSWFVGRFTGLLANLPGQRPTPSRRRIEMPAAPAFTPRPRTPVAT